MVLGIANTNLGINERICKKKKLILVSSVLVQSKNIETLLKLSFIGGCNQPHRGWDLKKILKQILPNLEKKNLTQLTAQWLHSLRKT